MFKVGKLKRALTLLSLGGTTFVCFSLPSLPSADFGGLSCCGLTNTNLSGFYQDACTASIATFEDATAAAVFGQESDFDNIVIEPVAAFWTSMLCDNCIPQDFPLDVGDANWME